MFNSSVYISGANAIYSDNIVPKTCSELLHFLDHQIIFYVLQEFFTTFSTGTSYRQSDRPTSRNRSTAHTSSTTTT